VVAELVKCCAVDRNRLRTAGKIAGQIDYMNAQIDQRSAAGAGFVAEPAAGAAVAAQISGLGVIDIAKITVVDKILQDLAVIAVAAHEADHQQLVIILCGLLHRESLRGVHCHRFFAEHILAGIQRGDGAFGMRGVPGADAHGIQLGKLEHFVLVGEQAGDAVLFALRLQALPVDIAECVKFHVRIVQITVDVAFGDVSHADDADLDFCHCRSSFPSCMLGLFQKKWPIPQL